MRKKALIYCRVSTEEQAKEGYSLNAQENFCRKFAENNEYYIDGIYRDEGKTATNLNRPALQDLLAKCQQDKSIDAVIFQDTDRLARNTQDHHTIRNILKKANVKRISVSQPMIDDSAEGNMIDTILASVNQFQSDINGRKTKKGLQEKFNSGWLPYLAPIGYVNTEKEDNHKIVTPDPEKWHLVKKGLKMYLTGNYSALEISDVLYKKGLKSRTGKKIPNSVMIDSLKNPFYAGIMRWDGQEKKGKHKPMITEKEHKQILTIMDAHNQHACRRRKHNFLLRGFVFCDICGQRYTAEKHRIGKNPDYYHCSAKTKKHSNKGQNIEVEELEKQVEKQFKKIQFSGDFIQLVLQKVRKFYEQRKLENNQGKKILLNKKIKIERKRDITEEKLISGTLSDGDFVRIKKRYQDELNGINNQLNEIEVKHDIDIDTIREALMLSRDIYKAYKKAPYEIKRLYLSFFWDRLCVKDKKIVKTKPTKLVNALIKEQKIIIRNEWLRRADSNRRHTGYTLS